MRLRLPWPKRRRPRIKTIRGESGQDNTLLDASGLSCPLPVLHARRTLAGMKRGMLLRVIATDPSSLKDFPVLSQQSGDELIEAREEDGKFLFLLRKT